MDSTNEKKNENNAESMKEINLNTEKDCIKQIERVYENITKYDYLFSVCLVGNANVGKTSLLTRYCDNIFKDKYSNTIGVDFRIISLKKNETNRVVWVMIYGLFNCLL